MTWHPDPIGSREALPKRWFSPEVCRHRDRAVSVLQILLLYAQNLLLEGGRDGECADVIGDQRAVSSGQHRLCSVLGSAASLGNLATCTAGWEAAPARGKGRARNAGSFWQGQMLQLVAFLLCSRRNRCNRSAEGIWCGDGDNTAAGESRSEGALGDRLKCSGVAMPQPLRPQAWQMSTLRHRCPAQSCGCESSIPPAGEMKAGEAHDSERDDGIFVASVFSFFLCSLIIPLSAWSSCRRVPVKRKPCSAISTAALHWDAPSRHQSQPGLPPPKSPEGAGGHPELGLGECWQGQSPAGSAWAGGYPGL